MVAVRRAVKNARATGHFLQDDRGVLGYGRWLPGLSTTLTDYAKVLVLNRIAHNSELGSERSPLYRHRHDLQEPLAAAALAGIEIPTAHAAASKAALSTAR